MRLTNNYIIFYFFFCSQLVFSQEMISIPAGKYIMGTNEYIYPTSGISDELENTNYTPHQVFIRNIKISKYEIDAPFFLQFLRENGKNFFDNGNTYEQLLSYNSEQYSDYPAVSTYLYALDFCSWLSKKTGRNFRLPTEAEWEYIATGGDGRNFPWGETYQSLSDIKNECQRLPLTTYQNDISPFGIMNIYGNVAEWVLDYFQSDSYQQLSNKFDPLCVDGKQLSGDGYFTNPPTYVVRGRNNYFYELDKIDLPINSFATIKRRFPYWYNFFARTSNENIGFRIVEDDIMIFNTVNYQVKYFYEIIMNEEKNSIYLYPDTNSEIIGNVEENELVQCFYITCDNNRNWFRIQKFPCFENDIGTNIEDKSIVGWIMLDNNIVSP